MAVIQGKLDETIYRILSWRGLNENPDGDTKLQMGEASVIRNFRVTRDGNLQKRPGLDQISGLANSYSLDIADTVEAAKVDSHVCAQLSMHANASATADGFVSVSGTSVVVTQDNWEDYVGYYWVYDQYHTWQFVSLSYDPENDLYSWGMKRVAALGAEDMLYMDTRVNGIWAGNVNGRDYLIASMEGRLYKLFKSGVYGRSLIGRIGPAYTRSVHMFGYSNKLYILGNGAYKEWDGTTLKDVEGYRPLISVSIAGTGGGTTLEQINKLNGLRRVWLSPDGTTTTFAMPEQALSSIDYIEDRATGQRLDPTTDYTIDLTTGTITFTAPPSAAVNSYEVGYSVSETDRNTILGMQFSEIFNGENDNRVFFYGDGSNRAIYSGLDYNGNPRADYFPDQNVLIIGETNTPVTALIRHHSRLLAFKTNSTYSIQFSLTTLADNTVVPAYYVTPVHRDIGNEAPGQVRLIFNAPFSLHGKDLFSWQSASVYSGSLSSDERSVKRISDRIYQGLATFDFPSCYCWDDNDAQEYYVCDQNRALVYNYAVDAWYFYDHFPAVCMCNYRGALYIGDDNGRVHLLNEEIRSDNGEAFLCYWESGSMAFDREYMRKYSAMLWVGIKPEGKAEVNVTIQTDRKSVYTEKIVASSLVSFQNADFRRWSFNTNRKPHQKRLKIKAKKFVYYKLIFQTDAEDTTATILNTDIRVRYTGYAR